MIWHCVTISYSNLSVLRDGTKKTICLQTAKPLDSDKFARKWENLKKPYTFDQHIYMHVLGLKMVLIPVYENDDSNDRKGKHQYQRTNIWNHSESLIRIPTFGFVTQESTVRNIRWGTSSSGPTNLPICHKHKTSL